MVDALATDYAVDIDCRDRRVLAGWGDAHELPLLCSTRSQAGHNLVPFSDDVLNREAQVRESRHVHGEGLFGSLETTWRTGRGSMIDLTGGNDFAEGSPLFVVGPVTVEKRA